MSVKTAIRRILDSGYTKKKKKNSSFISKHKIVGAHGFEENVTLAAFH